MAWSMSWKELAAVDNLDERRPLGVGGDHPDGGSVLDADALAEGVVGLTSAASLPCGSTAKGSAIVVGQRQLFMN